MYPPPETDSIMEGFHGNALHNAGYVLTHTHTHTHTATIKHTATADKNTRMREIIKVAEQKVAQTQGQVKMWACDFETTTVGHMTIMLDHMTTKLDHMTAKLGHMTITLGHMTITLGHMTIKLDHMTIKLNHMTIKLDHMTPSLFCRYEDVNNDKRQLIAELNGKIAAAELEQQKRLWVSTISRNFGCGW